MKKIEAIIQPHKLEAVKNALDAMGIGGLTVSEVRGFGRQKGNSQAHGGNEYSTEFVPKIKIELVVEDSQLSSAREMIVRQAKTGKIGDGKIFVIPVEETVRIRTGHTGEQAI